MMTKKKEKINIDESYRLLKEEAGEEIEQIELKKSFVQKQRERLEEQADIRRRVRQEQQYSSTDRKLEKLKMECESIQQRQKDNPNYMPSKAERKTLLSYTEAERKAKIKKQNDEKKDLERKVRRMSRRRNALTTVPKSVFDTIPYIADYEEGLFEIAPNLYSKTFLLKDINYQIAKEAEQIAIFCKYGEFLNYFTEDMLLNISIVNRRANQAMQESQIAFRMQNDGLDAHRKEYNRVLMRQLASGKNDMMQTKYATVTMSANNPFEAILKFHKEQSNICANLKKIGSDGKVLSTEERLGILHDILRQEDTGRFHIDFDFIKKQGISSKDYIAPGGFFFDSDYFMIDNKYYRIMFLNNLPASLSDDFLAKITDVDFPEIANMKIRPVDQGKGQKIVNKKVAGMEAEKIEYEKAAFRSGYNPDSISHSLKQSLEEGKELQDDMVNKNQKMFVTSFTIMVGGADSMDELNENCNELQKIAGQFTCTLQVPRFQQEQGFVQSLLLGHESLLLDRTLTTESTSIFIPFTSNELFEPGGFYYGLNSTSKNMILHNRSKMKAPHGFVLGSTGSGKSFATKREMLNVILNMSADEADMIIIDPDNEYSGFISAFGADWAEIINISANSNNHINPMELSKNYGDTDSDPLTLKSQFIMSLVEAMASRGNARQVESTITPTQRTIVDRAMRRTYEQLIQNNYADEYQPTFMDFQRELDREREYSEDGQDIAETVEYYTKGSMNVFAHKSNINLNKRLIVFNTKDLGGSLKSIGLLIIMDFVWNRMVENKERKKLTYFYIDEGHTIFSNPYGADYMRELFKRGRKYGLIITVITQDVEELLASEVASKMISNSNYILMLNQFGENAEILGSLLKLSDTQLGYITMADAGCGLLFADKVIVPFEDHFPEDSYLYKLMSTKFGEKLSQEDDSELSGEDEAILKKHFKFAAFEKKHGQNEKAANNVDTKLTMEVELKPMETETPEKEPLQESDMEELVEKTSHGEISENDSAVVDIDIKKEDVPAAETENPVELSDPVERKSGNDMPELHSDIEGQDESDIVEEMTMPEMELEEVENPVELSEEEKESRNEKTHSDLAMEETGSSDKKLEEMIATLSETEKERLQMLVLDKLLE